MPMTEADVLRRVTSVSLIAGGILMTAAAVTFPVGDPDETLVSLSAYSNHEVRGLLGAFGSAVGVWILAAGFSNTHHLIGQGAGAAWARLGWYTMVLGAAGITVAQGLTIGTIEVAVSWGDAPAESTFSVASGLFVASEAVYDLSIVAFWGGLAVIALGMTRTDAHPGWSSWSLLAIGAATAATGVLHLFSDVNPLDEYELLVLVGPTSVWAVLTGGWLAISGWAPDPAPA